MPSLGYFHPQLVHFAIVLCVVGVLFRLLALTGRASWANPAALVLLVVGAGAATLAAQSGLSAHGPVERIPGAEEAVEHHEDWGKRARNVFIGVGVVELLAVALRRNKAGRILHFASGLAGIGGLAVLYEAGEHGGELVYSYAGGVGTRSGDPADVNRLLVAGLYNGALAARKAGQGEQAARLIDQLAEQLPADPSVKLMVVESKLRDRNDPAGALEAARSLDAGESNRIKLRRGMLMAQAYRALSFNDSARVVLEGLQRDFPQAERVVKPLLDSLR